MFDGEHEIALHAMQWNRASSSGEEEVSLFLSHCDGNMGCILELLRGRSFQARVFSATSGLLFSYDGHLRKLLEAWQGNTDASRIETGDPGSLSFCHSDIGIPTNFQQESGIVTF